jgi:hypothetical protein
MTAHGISDSTSAEHPNADAAGVTPQQCPWQQHPWRCGAMWLHVAAMLLLVRSLQPACLCTRNTLGWPFLAQPAVPAMPWCHDVHAGADAALM